MKKKLQTQFHRNTGLRLICFGLLLSGFIPGISYASSAAGLSAKAVSNARVNITGTVKDSKGEPLPGVSVMIKGTKSGTSTDVNGVFRLNLPTGNETLVFSFVGFTTKEVTASGKTSITVVLNESASDLQEVVVVGYGTQKKATLTGAVATVDVKAVADIPVGSLSAAIRGQLPGVGVSGGFSRPGQDAQITIRNPVLLSKDGGDLRPLYVIDDVVKTENDFNLLDPTEVESISVLKDAAAAVYGINGTQGAVVVRTKRGQSGAAKISYSGSVGSADAVSMPKMMTGYELAMYLNDYNSKNANATPSTFYSPSELEYFNDHNYDWIDMGWKSSIVTKHALNVSGGTDKATYFASATYNYQDANLDGISSDKWTFRASADVKLTTGLKLGMAISSNLEESKMFWNKQGSESLDNDVLSLIQTPQFIPPYINGLPVYKSSGTNATIDNYHLFAVQKTGNYTKSSGNGFNVNINLQYDIPFIKGLTARAVYNKSRDNTWGKQFGTKYNTYTFTMLGDRGHIYGGDIANTISLKNGDMIRFNPTYSDNYQLNGSLNYERMFGKHKISFLALFEQREVYSDGIAAYKEGIIAGGTDNFSYATGSNILQSQSESENGYQSVVGRLNYSFANKYLFEATLRADGSTKFAPNYRWGYFPSFSLGWVVSEEGFFKDNIAFVDFLKLRSSIGFLGADRTRAYQWMTTYKMEENKGAVFGGNNGRGYTIAPDNAMSNPLVRWDNSTNFNAGLDATFLRDRLSFTADGYYNHNYNMLSNLTSSVAATVGAALPSENFGVVNTFGTEISIGWKDKIGSDFGYKINTFLSWSDNKYKKYDISTGLIGSDQDLTGKSGDQGVYGYKYIGMFRSQADVDAYLADHPGYKIFGQDPKPGMLYYEDISGTKVNGQFTDPDGVITDADQTYLSKKKDNHWGAGLNWSVSYKSFNLAVLMGASWGGKSVVEGAAQKVATQYINRPAFWVDHWTEENTDAKYPSPFYTKSYDGVTSDFWLRSSTTVRVSNINLSYSLPEKRSRAMGLSNCRLFVVATNPFDLYNPYDYKSSYGAYTSYPTLKSWSLGLNVGF